MNRFEEVTARRRTAAELRAPPNCMTMQQIADKLNVCVSTVHHYLKHAMLFGYDVHSHKTVDARGRAMPTRYARRKRTGRKK